MNNKSESGTLSRKYIITDPPFARTIFSDWRWAWIETRAARIKKYLTMLANNAKIYP